MQIIEIIIKVAVSLTLLNVWILRVNKRTPYRGGSAVSMKEEFDVYGLPGWFMYVVGFLKIISALLLLLSIYFKQIEFHVSVMIAILMLGALAMHIKIKDQFFKALPSVILLLLVLMIAMIKS